MFRKRVVERKIVVRDLREWEVGRSCAACGSSAAVRVYRAAGNGEVDESSRRFSCQAHATVDVLYPVVLRKKLTPLPVVDKRVHYRGDLSGFYANVIQEMGGTMPFPKKEKPAKERKRCWSPARPLKPKFVEATRRRFRPAGLSGRQWVKMRKLNGLAAKSR